MGCCQFPWSRSIDQTCLKNGGRRKCFSVFCVLWGRWNHFDQYFETTNDSCFCSVDFIQTKYLKIFGQLVCNFPGFLGMSSTVKGFYDFCQPPPQRIFVNPPQSKAIGTFSTWQNFGLPLWSQQPFSILMICLMWFHYILPQFFDFDISYSPGVYIYIYTHFVVNIYIYIYTYTAFSWVGHLSWLSGEIWESFFRWEPTSLRNVLGSHGSDAGKVEDRNGLHPSWLKIRFFVDYWYINEHSNFWCFFSSCI